MSWSKEQKAVKDAQIADLLRKPLPVRVVVQRVQVSDAWVRRLARKLDITPILFKDWHEGGAP